MTTPHRGATITMKPFHRSLLATAIVACLLPTIVEAGSDAPARPRRAATRAVHLGPPAVTVEETRVESVEGGEAPIQPLRLREESVKFRLAYDLLNNIGLTGTEADPKPVGYHQVSGPAPLFVYRRPAAPPPRRFPHFDDSAAEIENKPSPPSEPKPASTPEAGPAALPGLPALPAPARPSSEDHDETGILPDPTQQAAQSRNDEMLSYFQRPAPANRPQPPVNGSDGYGYAPTQGGDPLYLQAPVQNPLPPSRATYRVVPK